MRLLQSSAGNRSIQTIEITQRLANGIQAGTRKAGLRLDTEAGFFAARVDKKGKENTGHLKDAFGDDDLLTFIRNIYGVLLTRGMRGTYIYVCDPALRERLAALML